MVTGRREKELGLVVRSFLKFSENVRTLNPLGRLSEQELHANNKIVAIQTLGIKESEECRNKKRAALPYGVHTRRDYYQDDKACLEIVSCADLPCVGTSLILNACLCAIPYGGNFACFATYEVVVGTYLNVVENHHTETEVYA